jgi:hypothetical protein
VQNEAFKRHMDMAKRPANPAKPYGNDAGGVVGSATPKAAGGIIAGLLYGNGGL